MQNAENIRASSGNTNVEDVDVICVLIVGTVFVQRIWFVRLVGQRGLAGKCLKQGVARREAHCEPID